jgi:hypothetical protein
MCRITFCLFVIFFAGLAFAQENTAVSGGASGGNANAAGSLAAIDDTSYYDIGVNKPPLLRGLDGYYSVGMDSVKRSSTDNSSSSINQYLNIGFRGIGVRQLSLYVYGMLSSPVENADSYGELYLGYLQFKSLKGTTEIQLGRFDLVTNRFMTLDGFKIYQAFPWAGFSAYVGMPRYKEAEERDDEFRTDLGDLSYGGKIFFTGIPAVQANIAYYAETGKDAEDNYTVYRETLGGGLLFYKTLKDNLSFTADFHAEHDLQNDALARASAKFTGQFGRISTMLFVDYYDLYDTYPEGRELLIRMMSTGQETRYGADFYIELAPWLDVYGGVTHTEVTMRGGEVNSGQIYTLGADLVFDKAGFKSTVEGYNYDSVVSTVSGVMGNIKWHLSLDSYLEVTGEMAWFRNGRNDNQASSLEGRYTLYLFQNISLSAYGQTGSENRYVDRSRWGGDIKYEF